MRFNKSMITRVFRTNLCGLVLLMFAAHASADNASDLMEKMLDGMAFTSYSGTFIYTHDDVIDAIKIDTGLSEEGRFHSLHVLNGEPRQFEFNNGVLSWFRQNYWQKVGAPEQSTIKPSQLFSVWQDRLDKYYAIELAGQSRIADRHCQVVTIKPRDRLRYGYKLCVDESTHLLLESTLLDSRGKALEKLMFTQLSINDSHDEAQLMDDNNGKQMVKERTALDVPILQRMPAGFKLMSREMKRIDDSKAATEHWRISDGLANVSVYIEPAQQEAAALAGGSSIGAISVYGMIENGYQVTVIGDVPTSTLKIIADALGS